MPQFDAAQRQPLKEFVLSHTPEIDHAQLLRCHDGKWRLALMNGEDMIGAPLQADVGDAAGLELIMGMAARLISATTGRDDGP